jgi:hypothetical protein
MTEKAVFEIEFEKDSFIKSVGEAISSTENLDEALKGVTEQAKHVNFNKPITELNRFESSVRDIYKAMQKDAGLTNSEIDKQVNELLKSKGKITEFLNGLKQQINTTTDRDEFADLAQQISLTENALKELSGEAIDTGSSMKSAKTRLREMKAELIALEDAGLDDSEMFRQLTIESAQLTDQLGDQAEQIRVLSSDTFRLDAGVDIVNQFASAWGLAEGAMALFGVENEDVQKSIQRLVAIQSVANGLQEISTFLTGQSAGMIALKSGYNKILATTEALVATATNASTAATQAFSKALVATGIGAFIVGLGLLIANWESVSDAITGATDVSKTFDESQKDVTESVKEFNLDLIKVNNSFKAAKKGTVEKKEALKQYNDTLGDSIGYANSLEQAEALMAKNTSIVIESLKLKTQAQIFYSKAAEESAKVVSGAAAETTFLQDAQALALGALLGAGQGAVQNAQSQLKNIEETNAKAKVFNDEGNKLTNQAIENDKKLAKGALKPTDKKETKKQIENIYKELRDGFTADLKAINLSELTGMAKINAEAEKNYTERILKVNKAFQEGKLTKLQAKDLRQRVGLLQNAEIQKETKKFVEERDKALLEAEKESSAIQDEINNLRIENLQDSYSKELEVINNEEYLRLKAIEQSRIDGIDKIKELYRLGFIKTEEDVNKRILDINSKYDNLWIQNKLITNKALQEANRKRLEDLQSSLESSQDLIQSKIDFELSAEVLAQTKLLNEGAISRERYNSELERIDKEFQERKKNNQIKSLEAEIKNIDDQIKVAIDGEERKALEIERFKKLTEKNELQTKAKTDLTFFESLFGDDEKAKEKAKAVIDLTKEVFGVAANLIKENARLEQEAYDKAIKIQEDRVTEAQKIAEAGNSEYLQAEEDRLNDLEAKREASARKQLAIDQAIQASQILLAVAGAAAQIAKGGTADVIAGITTVIAAIGSGVSLVRQAQSARPAFYDGTDFLERGNNPAGKDTIPIMAHEGERIVPSYINKQLKGIKNSDLPKLIEGNLFDYNFVNVKDGAIPKADNSGLEKRLSNLEILQAENNEYLKKLSINVTMDSEGFATSISTMLDNKKKTNNA